MKNYVNHDDLGAFLPAKARDLEKLPCSLVVFPAENFILQSFSWRYFYEAAVAVIYAEILAVH